ncbi:MAG: molybdopterin converting factor subunit 1 [Betaproteobacteria bacterium]
MRLQILYFAGLKEALGVGAETVTPPPEVATIGQLRDWLIGTQGRTALASAKNLRCALNQEMVGFDAALAEGDEVAFFPPVTGG